MPQVTLDVPVVAIDALARKYNYQPFLADGTTPNPEAKGAFVRRMVIQGLKTEVKEFIDYEGRQAIDNPAPDIT